MELLHDFGSPEQQKRWLQPAARRRDPVVVRDEPSPTSPSPTRPTLPPRIERDGDEYVINGRKWWITGAMNPQAEIFIVMGKTDPSASRHRQQSMILVPRGRPRGDDRAGHGDLRL